MAAGDALQYIDDDELLYRKIPVSTGWHDPQVSDRPSSLAFKPHRDRDQTGISMDRAQSPEHPEFRTVEQAAEGRSHQGYYVAVLRVGDLRGAGIEVVAKPVDGNPGHVELPALTSANSKTPEAEQIMKELAEHLTLRVEGPFQTPA